MYSAYTSYQNNCDICCVWYILTNFLSCHSFLGFQPIVATIYIKIGKLENITHC